MTYAVCLHYTGNVATKCYVLIYPPCKIERIYKSIIYKTWLLQIVNFSFEDNVMLQFFILIIHMKYGQIEYDLCNCYYENATRSYAFVIFYFSRDLS